MALTSTIVTDGIKNVVVLVKSDSSTANTVVVDGATLNPPCRTFAIMEINYDVGTGNTCGIFFGTGAPVPVAGLSPGSGQTSKFDKWGGFTNSNPAVNRIISATTTVTGGDGVTFTLRLRKKY